VTLYRYGVTRSVCQPVKPPEMVPGPKNNHARPYHYAVPRRAVGEYQQTQPCLLARGDRLWELIICNTYKYFVKYRKIKSYVNCLLQSAIYTIFQIFLYCHGLRGNPTPEGEAFDARVCMPKTKRFSEAVRWIASRMWDNNGVATVRFEFVPYIDLRL
jgi:hypothetical protein